VAEGRIEMNEAPGGAAAETPSGSSFNSSAIAVADQAVVSLVRFAVGLTLARMLAPADYGVFVLCFGIYFFIAAIHTAVVTDPLMILGAPLATQPYRRYFAAATQLHWIFSLTGTACLVAGWYMASAVGLIGDDLAGVLPPLAFAVVAMLTQALVRAALFARDRPGQVLVNDILFCAVQAAAIPILSRFHALDNRWIFGSMGIAGAIAVLAAGAQALPNVARGAWRLAREGFERNWSIGKWLVGTVLSYWTSGQAGFFIAASFLGASAPGVLKACQNLLAPTHLLIMGLDAVMVTTAARHLQQGGSASLQRYLRNTGIGLVALTGAFALVVCTGPEFLLRLAYKETYAGYSVVVYWMAAQYLCVAIMKPFVVGLKVAGRTQTVFYAYLLSAVASILLAVPFILRMGLNGAAASAALSTLCGAVAVMLAYAMCAKHPGSSLLAPALAEHQNLD